MNTDEHGLGPGKYGPEAEQAYKATGADGVLLIVIGGPRGSGFSVQASEGICRVIPEILRDVADSISKSMAERSKQ